MNSAYTENMICIAASKIWVLKMPETLALFYSTSFLFFHWKAREEEKRKGYWENMVYTVVMAHT